MLAVTGCKHSDFPDYPANYREFAYVANSGSDTVTVLDLVHIRADRTLAVGRNPSGVTASAVRNEVYVANTGSNSVSVIDTAAGRVVANIPVGKSPFAVSVPEDGRFAYTANSGSNNVSVLDLNTRRNIASIGVGERPGLARATPGGDAVVVSNYGSGSVTVLEATAADGARLHVRSTFAGCPGATDIAVLPDGSKAFVACSLGRQVMAVGLAHGASANHPATPDALLAMLDVGKTPYALAMKPDGGEIFVSNYDDDSISEIATGADEVGGTYTIGARPSQGIVSADNSTLYESNFGADNITAYSIDDGKIAPPTMPAGHQPDALALTAAGHLLLAVNAGSGDVVLLRTKTQSLLTMLPVGAKPVAIAVKAFSVK